MTRLLDLPIGESITGLFYGPAGCGKTELLGSGGSDVGIINCGLGHVTLQSPGFKQRHPNANPDIETIIEDILPDRATGFDQICDATDKFLADPSIKIIALDDATTFRRFAMSKGLEVNQSENKSQSLGKSKTKGMIIKAIQDYGTEMDLVDQYIVGTVAACKAANKHFFMVAHERIQYAKPPGPGQPAPIDRIRPGFTGQTFPDQVTGHFDLVWYLETIGAGNLIKFQATTIGARYKVAKTRWSGLFNSEILNPTLPMIINKIREVK